MNQHSVIAVASFLLDSGLIGTAGIVENGLSIEDATRRNRNLRLVAEGGTSFFLKQAPSPDLRKSIAREDAIYRYLAAVDPDTFRRYRPTRIGFDADEGVLILELLEGAQDFDRYHLQRPTFSTSIHAELGDAVGQLHLLPLRTEGVDNPADFDHGPTWALSMHHPHLSFLRTLSWGNLKLFKILQSVSEFGDHLDRLRAEWRPESFIHFDLRWENILVTAGRRPRLKIIDWEFAGLGDACWDVGTLLSDYLSFWVSSMPVTAGMPSDQIAEMARFPLVDMEPAIQAFWEAYVHRRNLTASQAGETLRRSAGYAAVRLLETAYTRTQRALEPGGDAVLLIQLSFNMLEDPDAALHGLFGFPRQEVFTVD